MRIRIRIMWVKLYKLDLLNVGTPLSQTTNEGIRRDGFGRGIKRRLHDMKASLAIPPGQEVVFLLAH
jgi:hypothetical protein